MKSNKKINKNTCLALCLILIVSILIISAYKLTQPKNLERAINQTISDISPTAYVSQALTPAQKTTIYHSKSLKITIDMPDDISGTEDLGTIILKKNNAEGTIKISTNGTNNDSIEGYLYDIGDKNHLQITDKKNITIHNLNGIVAMLHGYKDTDKSYFFYPAPWTIYYLSTSSPVLFNDLDQIAQSFRFTP